MISGTASVWADRPPVAKEQPGRARAHMAPEAAGRRGTPEGEPCVRCRGLPRVSSQGRMSIAGC